MGVHPALQQRAAAVLGPRRPGLAGRPSTARRATARRADAQAEALEKLSAALEATDPYTHGHSRRVARHCWMIAKRMGLDSETRGPREDRRGPPRRRQGLHAALGPAQARAAHRRGVRRHQAPPRGRGRAGEGAGRRGARLDRPPPPRAPRRHRLSGPARRASEIPIGARIISVADTFDAITSARPYRPARAHKKALDILKYEAGTQLDPAVVKAFCAIYSGRRPLALWASFTSLPSQVFSWLGAGAATAASAAQVAAVAAAAAVGVTAAMQPHHDRGRHGPRERPRPARRGCQPPPDRGELRIAASTRATHGGVRAEPQAVSAAIPGGSKPAPASAGSTSARGPTGPTDTAGEASGSQAGQLRSHQPVAAAAGPAQPRRLLHAQRTGRHRKPVLLGSKRLADRHRITEARLGPKEGKGSDEGKKGKEEKEDKEAKAKEERAAREAKEAKTKEEKDAKEAKAREENQAKEAKAKEEKAAKEAKAKEEKAAKEAKAREENQAKEAQGQAGKESQRSQRSQGQGRKKGQRRQRARSKKCSKRSPAD